MDVMCRDRELRAPLRRVVLRVRVVLQARAARRVRVVLSARVVLRAPVVLRVRAPRVGEEVPPRIALITNSTTKNEGSDHVDS